MPERLLTSTISIKWISTGCNQHTLLVGCSEAGMNTTKKAALLLTSSRLELYARTNTTEKELMMDANFWRQKWLEGDIGFHQHQVEPALVAYLAECKLPAKARIFLPLCGKTLDMVWLQQQGYQVVGAELSELAVEQFFQSLGVVPDITEYPRHRHYRTTDIEIWLGDLFDINRAMLGQVDAVYDRAALVALPDQMRSRYAQQISAITAQAPQLLLSFVYEQQLYADRRFSDSRRNSATLC